MMIEFTYIHENIEYEYRWLNIHKIIIKTNTFNLYINKMIIYKQIRFNQCWYYRVDDDVDECIFMWKSVLLHILWIILNSCIIL